MANLSEYIVNITARIDNITNIGNAGLSVDLQCFDYDTHMFTCDQSTLTVSMTDFAVGRTINIIISGGETCSITWPVDVLWSGGSPPTFSSGVDRVVMQRVSSTIVHASLAGGEYA